MDKPTIILWNALVEIMDQLNLYGGACGIDRDKFDVVRSLAHNALVRYKHQCPSAVIQIVDTHKDSSQS